MRLGFIIFIAVAVYPCSEMFSQQILISPSGSDYNISANIPTHPRIFVSPPASTSSNNPNIVENSWTPSPDDPGTVLLMEYGDGTFSFSNSELHNYNNSVHKYGVFMKTTGIYDRDKRPPRASINQHPTFTTLYSSANSSQRFPVSSYARSSMLKPLLGDTSNILVQPNISSLVAGDTMIFILTYKVEEKYAGRKINFYYNNNDFFIPLRGGEEIKDDNMTVPFIRFFGDEEFEYKNSEREYLNHIVINNLLNDGAEHNIFITLVPKEDLKAQDLPSLKESKGEEVLDENKLTANIQADLVDENGNTVGTSKNELEVLENSHDPNYIRILPKCLPFPKTDVKVLKFHAHCQNIGLGDAMTVRMAIALPYGLKSPDIYDKSVKLPNGVTATWNTNNNDSVVITFTKTTDNTLRGIKNNPLWLNDPGTMGDVWFKLKTNASVYNELETQASIVFSNTDSTFNDPVLTNTDRAAFSACCDCKNKTEKCGCSKKKSRFWRWLFCKKC